MGDCSEVFGGVDVAKIAMRWLAADAMERSGSPERSARTAVPGVVSCARPGVRVRFCHEAGLAGYRLQRLLEGLGSEWGVIRQLLFSQPTATSLEIVGGSAHRVPAQILSSVRA